MRDDGKPAGVWVDPGRCGGMPCIYGSRIQTRTAAETVWACGFDEALHMWPHLTEDDLLVACWYEAVHGNRRWRKRFGPWMKEYQDAMWYGRWSEVSRPPDRDADFTAA